MTTAPYSALSFGGTLTVDASDLPEKPITITARTTADAYQGFWGRCVHDLNGFRKPEGPIPLDYDHDCSEAIGVASEFAVENGKLIAKGKLVPFVNSDKASEVIFKGSKGVPYQASINMDPDGLQVERVADGQTVAVNGTTFTGPGAVFRKWGIKGIAILPYGADSTTSVEFARGKPEFEVNFINQPSKENVMTDPVITPPTVPPVAAPAAAPVENADYFSRAKFLQFRTAFGAPGVDWYMEGKTFEEASQLFAASQKAEIDALKAKIEAHDAEKAALITERDALKAKAEFRRGQPAPVPVKPGETPEPDAKPDNKANFFGRSDAMQRLVDATALRMKAPAKAA